MIEAIKTYLAAEGHVESENHSDGYFLYTCEKANDVLILFQTVHGSFAHQKSMSMMEKCLSSRFVVYRTNLFLQVLADRVEQEIAKKEQEYPVLRIALQRYGVDIDFIKYIAFDANENVTVTRLDGSFVSFNLILETREGQ